ncbi:ABC transporter ATP-binding protein [Fluviispira vulneris]|nr:ABC transporter ATP-binding protein [Fluviispira vulneris]
MTIKKNIKLLIRFIGFRSLFWLAINFFFSLFLAVIELFVALFLQLFLINLGIIDSSPKILNYSLRNIDIYQAILMLICVGILRFIFQVIVNHSNNFINEYCSSRLRIYSISDFLYNKSKTSNDVSEMNYRLSEIFPKTNLFISSFIYLLSMSIQCLFLVILLFLTSWKETIFCMLCLSIIGLICLKVNKLVRTIADLIPIEQLKLNQGIQRISRNLLFINIMKSAYIEYNSLIKNILRYSSKSIKASILNVLNTTIPSFLGIILLVSTIYFSIVQWKTSPLVLVSFIYLLVRFIQSLSSLINYYGVINTYSSQAMTAIKFFKNIAEEDHENLERILKNLSFFGNEKKIKLSAPSETNKTNCNYSELSDIPSIHFNEVSFTYPETNSTILENIDFSIKPGECVGIIGSSGSGKSTLLMLLLGILKPTKGSIFISNTNPYLFFQNMKVRVGYVGAEPFLVKGTIKENLLYGIKREVNDKDIMLAVEASSLKELVEKCTLDYYISEDQTGLSAGQKQRICLARALLNNPHILLLDEATANLDEKIESEIVTTVEKLKEKTTIIIVSHRQGILRSADKVIDLNSFVKI